MKGMQVAGEGTTFQLHSFNNRNCEWKGFGIHKPKEKV